MVIAGPEVDRAIYFWCYNFALVPIIFVYVTVEKVYTRTPPLELPLIGTALYQFLQVFDSDYFLSMFYV